MKPAILKWHQIKKNILSFSVLFVRKQMAIFSQPFDIWQFFNYYIIAVCKERLVKTKCITLAKGYITLLYII